VAPASARSFAAEPVAATPAAATPSSTPPPPPSNAPLPPLASGAQSDATRVLALRADLRAIAARFAAIASCGDRPAAPASAAPSRAADTTASSRALHATWLDLAAAAQALGAAVAATAAPDSASRLLAAPPLPSGLLPALHGAFLAAYDAVWRVGLALHGEVLSEGKDAEFLASPAAGLAPLKEERGRAGATVAAVARGLLATGAA
jgi:hypothetical protein